MGEQRYAVAVDFDGVIHSYTSGWKGADVIPDPPVDGAIDFLRELAAADYDVVIRARHDGGAEAAEAYLRQHGFDGPVLVTAEKVPALFYIDDRGWRFRGRFPSLRQIRYMKPWRVGDAENPRAVDRLRERGKQLKALQDKQHKTKWELKQASERLDRLRARAAVLRESVEFREAVEPLYPDLKALVDELLA
jgi:hypothetical protein